jgi:RNA polymerase sigma-70 factor, ECF subfamily
VLTLENVDSRDLMARAQHGDPDAFAQLYTRHRRYVLAIAQRMHPGHAEDIAQDAWIRALRSLHRWRDEGIEPVAWLAVITRNICRDRARSAYVQRVDLVDDVPDRPDAPERTDPALLTGRLFARRDVLAALRRVSARQREALVLYYLGELSVAEVAVRMGQPESTVKNLLHHGRRSMAGKLQAVADA